MESPSPQNSVILPTVKNTDEDNGILKFTIENCNVSIINALRRTVISDIDCVVINNIEIFKNTTKFNNEILSHRLACMPVHIKDLNDIDNLSLEINEENDTNTLSYITTRNIQITNKNTDTRLTVEEEKSIFPADSVTKCYPLFARLKPKLTQDIPGEVLHLKASLGIGRALDNGMYNVACTCAYRNTPDVVVQNDEWQKVADMLTEKEYEASAIAYEKENWFNLQAKRFYKKDSFDFQVESVGVFTNMEIIHKACDKIISSLNDIIKKADSNLIEFKKNTTTMENSVDVILMNYGYTIGKLIEFILYKEYFQNDNKLSYIGFVKKHPHDDFSILRLAFNSSENFTDSNCNILLKFACTSCIEIFNHIKEAF